MGIAFLGAADIVPYRIGVELFNRRDVHEVGRGSIPRRPRWLVMFTIMLLGISAVPVLADSPPPDPPPAGEVNWASDSEVQTPDAAEITEALQKVEEREAANSKRVSLFAER